MQSHQSLGPAHKVRLFFVNQRTITGLSLGARNPSDAIVSTHSIDELPSVLCPIARDGHSQPNDPILTAINKILRFT